MLLAFQILVSIIIAFCFLGTIGADTKDMRQHCTAIVMTGIVAMVVLFIL